MTPLLDTGLNGEETGARGWDGLADRFGYPHHLMAMAETDGRGFFLLDEPFAHLSLDRVDQVGRFLRASRSQFLLTAPTTLDRAQLDPAAMVIVLQKKRPGEPHAPVPIVAEA